MQRQLPLLETGTADWRLDDRTREVGRRGLAEARMALRAAAQRDAQRLATRAGREGVPPCGPGAAAA